MRRSANVAECVDITNITLSTNPKANLKAPYSCTPDGKTLCQYRTRNQEIAFSLVCECGLSRKDNVDLGFCPIPDRKQMIKYIDKMKKVWF